MSNRINKGIDFLDYPLIQLMSWTSPEQKARMDELVIRIKATCKDLDIKIITPSAIPSKQKEMRLCKECDILFNSIKKPDSVVTIIKARDVKGNYDFNGGPHDI